MEELGVAPADAGLVGAPPAVAIANFGGRGALGGDFTVGFAPPLCLVMIVGGAGVEACAFEEAGAAFCAFAAAAAFFAAFFPRSPPGALVGGAGPAFFLSLGFGPAMV